MDNFKTWFIKKFGEEQDNSNIDPKDLVWIEENLQSGKKINWNYADTVDYHINKIPTKQEIILEISTKEPAEVKECVARI